MNVEGKDFHTPDHQQIDQPFEQATQCVVGRVIDHVNTQVRHLESLMSKHSLDERMQPRSNNNGPQLRMGPVEHQSDSLAIVDPPRPSYSNKTPKLSILYGEVFPGKHEISFE